MKKKRSVLQDLLFVSISSFIVAAAWIGFNVYHTWVTTTITPEMQVTITSINPTFDEATIKKLKARKQVTPISTLSGKGIPTPSPSPADQPGAASSADASTILQAPTATTESAAGIGAAVQPQVSEIPVTVSGE